MKLTEDQDAPNQNSDLRYRFHQRVFEGAYVPFYDAYKGHEFRIAHDHGPGEGRSHVWLVCTSDPNIKVRGYVHLSDLVVI